MGSDVSAEILTRVNEMIGSKVPGTRAQKLRLRGTAWTEGGETELFKAHVSGTYDPINNSSPVDIHR